MSQSTKAKLGHAAADVTIRQDVLVGLNRIPKRIPSKYFYDERGSQLFDQICDLEEYYPTRTELRIMEQRLDEIAEELGPRRVVMEYGSGSGVKTRLLLRALPEPLAYIPVEISASYLQESTTQLEREFPDIELLPVCADFTQPFTIPKPRRENGQTVVYFPGSTIGNFSPAQKRELLCLTAARCGMVGSLLIGIDLKKERETLEAAYNDARGVTAAFNLNLLVRLNRELQADFTLDSFAHRAHYNPIDGRIEMHLVSLVEQTIRVADQTIRFDQGESICTEYSYKYEVDEFEALATECGFQLRSVWTDDERMFAILLLDVTG